jgi:hypothetical protein
MELHLDAMQDHHLPLPGQLLTQVPRLELLQAR